MLILLPHCDWLQMSKESQTSSSGQSRLTSSQLYDLYRRLDTDGNGTLDKHEFMQGLLNMGVALNEAELELLFSFFERRATLRPLAPTWRAMVCSVPPRLLASWK